MSDQPNALFTVRWMLPLLKQQLLELHNKQLKQPATADNLAQICHGYQQVFEKLHSADLVDFANVAQAIYNTTCAVSSQQLSPQVLPSVVTASKQLLQELSYYVEIGTYQPDILHQCEQHLQQLSTGAVKGHLKKNSKHKPEHDIKPTQVKQEDNSTEDDRVIIALPARYDTELSLDQTLTSSQPKQTDFATDSALYDKRGYKRLSHSKTYPTKPDSSIQHSQSLASLHSTKAAGLSELLKSTVDEVHLPSDDPDCDVEIKQIFVEEAQEVLQAITEAMAQLTPHLQDKVQLGEVRRGFHTLKGSGRMVGAHTIAELAWAIENMLNRLLDDSIEPTTGIWQLLTEVVAQYPALVAIFAEPASADKPPLYPSKIVDQIAAANLYANNKHTESDDWQLLQPQLSEAIEAIETIEAINDDQAHLPQRLPLSLDAAAPAQSTALRNSVDNAIDEAELAQVFIAEATELLQSIDAMLAQHQDSSSFEVDDKLLRAFHTLRGAASSQSLTTISQLSAAVEQNLEQLQQSDQLITPSYADTLRQSIELIKSHLQQQYPHPYLEQTRDNDTQHHVGLKDAPIDAPIAEPIAEHHDDVKELDSDIGSHVALSVAELIDGIDDLLDAEWRLLPLAHTTNEPIEDNEAEQSSEQSLSQQSLQGYVDDMLQQIKQLSLRVGHSAKFISVLNCLQLVYQAFSNDIELAQKWLHDRRRLALLIAVHEQLTGLFDALAGRMTLKVDDTLLAQLGDELNKAQASRPLINRFSAEPKSKQGLSDDNEQQNTEADAELLAIFIEEAQQLDTDSQEQLRLWQQNPTDLAPVNVLLRYLHTLKGGARMAGIDSLAELTHEAETLYEYLLDQQIVPDANWVALMQSVQDTLSAQVDSLVRQRQSFFVPELVAKLQTIVRSKRLPESDVKPIQLYPSRDTAADHDKVSVKATIMAENKAPKAQSTENIDHKQSAHDISQMPPSLLRSDSGATQDSSNEMIRVPAKLMEQMIDLSAESAIRRSSIELNMSSVAGTLSEMESTVQRLAEQLRRMDIELEAQIRSQIEDHVLQADQSFDPLEMDQYSALNQLSKSLSESASDLLEIRTSLRSKTRETESLLLQLSQTQTQMQEGLMSSRMVPFSRLLPRLQRTLRQTANEVGKEAKLELITDIDEIDRTVLERLTAPLEHMIRNAIDHGLETPDQREALGKPRTGNIIIEMGRKGSEIVIRVKDDGQGIDVNSVRKKAIACRLMDAQDNTLSDLEVMQYIFHAGLSTASSLTQISGRGVGMDVVLNEVRQLGGNITVHSSANQGTEFTLTLPLTLAVIEALVVRAGDQTYAVPLLQIERIERIAAQRLRSLYDSKRNRNQNGSPNTVGGHESAQLNVGGKPYRVRYLTQLLSGETVDVKVFDTQDSLPVLLIKHHAGQSFALHVDEIIGYRSEVVVKPLGRPLSSIAGLSAATITAEGSVMLILDVQALIRKASLPISAQSRLSGGTQPERVIQNPAPATKSIKPQILIVDDSVTVRKVTARMLQRQGYQAHVARDGVEAVEMLQTLRPDLMLLDIEMPRMDGFEVATHVRHNQAISHLPIIMITSRSGDKHRQRALKIGVNAYLGKPFQEAKLVALIQNLIS